MAADRRSKRKRTAKEEALERLEELEALNPPRELYVAQTLTDNYMPYAMSVIVSRALPEIDGFKPSHRKLLYCMYKMGLMKGPRAKSADIVGRTMALNPHGDQAIYDTMVRMTRGNGALLYPYIDSKGNFGKFYSRDMQCAAYRYTEAKLAPICDLLFDEIEADAVDFVPNYSNTLEEPILLPAKVPTILLNANQGIAVGMASNICSFNLEELTDLVSYYLTKGWPSSDKILLDLLPGPDFSTGGLLLWDAREMTQIYETGRGSFKLRALVDHDPKERTFTVREIPYNTTLEQIMDEVVKQVKDGKLKEVTDLRDETDLDGLKVVIEYKASTDPEFLRNKLFHLTSLESSFSCNFNVLLGQTPQVLGIQGILDAWLAWRKASLRRILSKRRQDLLDKLEILEALKTILLDIDEAIRIIRATPKENEVVANLEAHFKINRRQAEAVADIKLRNLNREYLLRRTEEIDVLHKEVEDCERTLQEEKRQEALILEDLAAAKKKYGQGRRTQIVAADEVSVIKDPAVELVPDYPVQIFFTKEGFCKKVAASAVREDQENRLKDGDYIVESLAAQNKDEVLFFTNTANVHKRFIYELTEVKWGDLGEPCSNFLELDPGEEVVFIQTIDPETYPGEFLFVFADAQAVRLPAEVYATKQKRRRLKNAFYGKAPLVYMSYRPSPLGPGEEDSEDPSEDASKNAPEDASAGTPNDVPHNASEELLLLVTKKNRRAILLDVASQVVSKSSRTSQGNRIFRLRSGDELGEVYAWPSLSDVPDLYLSYQLQSLPAVGKILRDKDLPQKNSLFDLFPDSIRSGKGEA